MAQHFIVFRATVRREKTIIIPINEDFTDRQDDDDKRPHIVCYLPDESYEKITKKGFLWYAVYWDLKNPEYILDGPTLMFMWRYVVRIAHASYKTEMSLAERNKSLLKAELQNDVESYLESPDRKYRHIGQRLKAYWESKTRRVERLPQFQARKALNPDEKFDTSSGYGTWLPLFGSYANDDSSKDDATLSPVARIIPLVTNNIDGFERIFESEKIAEAHRRRLIQLAYNKTGEVLKKEEDIKKFQMDEGISDPLSYSQHLGLNRNDDHGKWLAEFLDDSDGASNWAERMEYQERNGENSEYFDNLYNPKDAPARLMNCPGDDDLESLDNTRDIIDCFSPKGIAWEHQSNMGAIENMMKNHSLTDGSGKRKADDDLDDDTEMGEDLMDTTAEAPVKSVKPKKKHRGRKKAKRADGE